MGEINMSKWDDKVLFSSKAHDWETPAPLFNAINDEFAFTLDAAASPGNAKCARYFTEKDDALSRSWQHNRVWVNPPYGRGIKVWMEKCAREGLESLVVALVFARTDTRWFHDWVVPYALEVRFIKGRVSFVRGDETGPAPAPSMLVIWAPCTKYKKPNAVEAMIQP